MIVGRHCAVRTCLAVCRLLRKSPPGPPSRMVSTARVSGDDFLSSRHTAKHVRTAQWRPTIINRQGYVRWQEEGGLDLREKARRKALQLLETHQPEPLPDGVAASIDALVAGFTPEA